jgi:hypothetical protein
MDAICQRFPGTLCPQPTLTFLPLRIRTQDSQVEELPGQVYNPKQQVQLEQKFPPA